MGPSRCIVVVCDDRALRDELGAWFTDSGHAVTLCATGAQALPYLLDGEGTPPILIVDLDLLDLSAWGLIELIRADDRPPPHPIAAISRVELDERLDDVALFVVPVEREALLAWSGAHHVPAT